MRLALAFHNPSKARSFAISGQDSSVVVEAVSMRGHGVPFAVADLLHDFMPGAGQHRNGGCRLERRESLATQKRCHA